MCQSSKGCLQSSQFHLWCIHLDRHYCRSRCIVHIEDCNGQSHNTERTTDSDESGLTKSTDELRLQRNPSQFFLANIAIFQHHHFSGGNIFKMNLSILCVIRSNRECFSRRSIINFQYRPSDGPIRSIKKNLIKIIVAVSQKCLVSISPNMDLIVRISAMRSGCSSSVRTPEAMRR